MAPYREHNLTIYQDQNNNFLPINKKMNLLRIISKPIKRVFSNAPPKTPILEQLKSRAIIKLTGENLHEYLQGLITNDIRHLQKGKSCMYTLLLNTKGRVLYDAILYNNNEENSLFLECDQQIVGQIIRHLTIYKLRRKIDINLQENLAIFALFSPIENESNLSLPEGLLAFKDPRISSLGLRIIAEDSSKIQEYITDLNPLTTESKFNYKKLRYNLGVGEGVNDLPVGNCFPLECNCDYMHGVSFHKGCYIGQELTARTHHTGVTRKRFMPLIFSKVPSSLPEDSNIIHKNVNLGKLRGLEGNVGLGLLRIEKVLELNEFQVGNGLAKARRPDWWPVEMPKERASQQKP